MNNLIITPHIGGVTIESVDQANLFMIRKLENYLYPNKIIQNKDL